MVLPLMLLHNNAMVSFISIIFGCTWYEFHRSCCCSCYCAWSLPYSVAEQSVSSLFQSACLFTFPLSLVCSGPCSLFCTEYHEFLKSIHKIQARICYHLYFPIKLFHSEHSFHSKICKPLIIYMVLLFSCFHNSILACLF